MFRGNAGVSVYDLGGLRGFFLGVLRKIICQSRNIFLPWSYILSI
jgi:hypothetical protein